MAVTNAFADAIRAFALKADRRANLCVKKIVFDVGTRIVLKSPVGNPLLWKSPPPAGYVGGRFRANWQLGVDKINLTTTEQIDKTGVVSIRRLDALPDQTIGHVFYWTNSLAYSIALENGYSSQAPPGHIIRLTVLEFDPIVRTAAAGSERNGMSNTKIKQAGEIHLVALAPGFPSAWENVNFKPPVGPYQIPTWAFADPDDRGNKDAPYLQRGIFTITLAYPTNQGGGAAQAKAEAIKDWFKKGTTIPSEEFNLIIDREPEITGGRIEETRYIVRVLIRFFAWIDRYFDSTSNYLLPVLSIGLPQVQNEGDEGELVNGTEW